MVFPLELAAHYLRCLDLCRRLEGPFDIEIAYSSNYKEFTQDLGLESFRVEDFDPGNKVFDIILLHNSINHLDEVACANLQHDSQSVETYRAIFQKLSNMASHGAKLIINTDAHQPRELFTKDLIRKVGLGAGLTEEELQKVFQNSEDLVRKRF